MILVSSCSFTTFQGEIWFAVFLTSLLFKELLLTWLYPPLDYLAFLKGTGLLKLAWLLILSIFCCSEVCLCVRFYLDWTLVFDFESDCFEFWTYLDSFTTFEAILETGTVELEAFFCGVYVTFLLGVSILYFKLFYGRKFWFDALLWALFDFCQGYLSGDKYVLSLARFF